MRNGSPARLTELKEALALRPRVPLVSAPTPLEPLPNLTRALGGPTLYIKRDDLTGLAMGGNKTRTLEYALGEAVARGCDTVVAGAAVQSNYCRQLAAACAKLGLECHLILRKVAGMRNDEIQGGLLLDLLLGAKVTLLEPEQARSFHEQAPFMRRKAEALQQQGRTVFLARPADESRLGVYACGYAHAAAEMVEQADAMGLRIDEVWLSSADTTQAGLAIGLKHIGSAARVVGVMPLHQPITPTWTFAEAIAHAASQCAEILGLPTRLAPAEVTALLDYVGPDYSIPTPESNDALRLLGRTDAIILDPVYTAKAMAGLLDHIRQGRIGPDKNVVFLHTGGLPALFAYHDTLHLEDLLQP